MEHLSPFQLQKYEKIIKKIEDEHLKRNELVNQLQVLDNKIIATGVILKKDVLKEKIFKVFVKIINSVFEIHDLSDKISTSEIENLSACINCKFYCIEVYVSKSFQERIIQKNWLISVSIKKGKIHINKNLSLNRKITNPICLIIPFENSIEEAIVDVNIAWPGNSTWPDLQIASITVDISYHFHLYLERSIRNNFLFKVINLSNLYGFKSITLKLPVVKSKLSCHADFDDFLKIFIKNSYHNWDPRKESCFSKSEYTVTAKAAAGVGNAIGIELDTSTNSLTLHGNAEELFQLKEYITREFYQEIYLIRKDIDKIIKALLENFENNKNVNALINIYHELNDINI